MATSKSWKYRWIWKPTPLLRPSSSTTSTIFQISATPERVAAAKKGCSCGRITWRSRFAAPKRYTAAISSSSAESVRAPSRSVTATFGILLTATAPTAAASFRPNHT